MTGRGLLLESHALVVRDGRIIDLLPHTDALARYQPAASVDRPSHLVMPGLVNAHADAPLTGIPGAPDERFMNREFVRDCVLMSVAGMLKSGITCFGDMDPFPDETARAAAQQGMRAAVGLPVSDAPGPWARDAGECLSKALAVRDEFRGHPLVLTAFAPQSTVALEDAMLARIATLADELDAGIFTRLHESAAEIGESMARHGRRPLQRLADLGMLTPALNAIHMSQLDAGDIDRAARAGIAVTLCLGSDLRLGAAPPIAALARAGVRLAAGGGGPAANRGRDLWGEIRLLALLSGLPAGATPGFEPWDALAIATCGGASALGLDAHTGTLEAGKWADLCCVDLSGPPTQPLYDPLPQLVYSGGREMVSDVWVAGRQLLADSEFTRLDWPGVSARAGEWAARCRRSTFAED
jgi:5-methylthioadenosine/S-adenosylhomocysteine deaminase